MKRYNNIYPIIYNKANLRKAYKKAKKNKNKAEEIKYFEDNKERLLDELQQSLKNKTFKTSEYNIYNIVDKGKERKIYDLPFYPDRLVHWAIMIQIEQIFLKAFIYDTYAAIPNKGGHLALKRIKHEIKINEKECEYCLKIDIKKFFPNINQEILKNLIRKKIKDKDLLWLLDGIINSTDKGIPIGNYLSQYFGNYYLTYFDHWCKEELGLKRYWRYMDDVVVLHESKEFLHEIKLKMDKYLDNNLKIKIKDNWQVFPTYTRGIDFIGYRIFRDYVLLRKSTANNFKSKMRGYLKHCENGYELNDHQKNSIASYKGWLKWCNSYNLYKEYIVPLEKYYRR